MFGYMGKILRVNLTKGEITEEPLEESVARKFIGGRGLGAYILFNELKPGIDPLGTKNKLVVATGVITGIPFPGNSGLNVMAKSPLTGIWGESTAKGFFGPELKSSGYDAIVIEGKAKTPVYLWVHDGEAEIRDASRLWGRPTREVQRIIKAELKDDRVQVGCIGIAGENLVKFANIMFGFNHFAGRTGMGAVMGSKKLKAIAVRGTGRVRYAREEKLVDLLMEKLNSKEALSGPYFPDGLFKYGSLADLGYWQETGRLTTMNFRKCLFPGYENITAETLATSPYLIRNNTCPHCTVGCNRITKANDPYELDPEYATPEYESTAALSSLCMNDNLVATLKAIELCNRYGMDTMSTGVTIAFAMECYEKGKITKKDTDGLDLTWGNHEAIIQLIEKIARRQGIGSLLAEGSRRAAEKLGGGAEEFAMHVKGMEFPLHDVRGMKGHGLGIATSNRGACHLQVETDDMFEGQLDPDVGIDETTFPKEHRDRLYAGPEKVKIVKIIGDLFAVFDSLVICKWTVYPCGGYKTRTIVDVVATATGWDFTMDELMKTGERIFNLCRAFNVREGITRKDDKLPKRFTEPLPEGPYKGEAFPEDVFERMLNHFYRLRGWNKKTGIPTRKKLEELELRHVADNLENLGIIPPTPKRKK
ncbi:MAG: aldehyde ferredoxin oxidoreductase family protein [Candidatus Bathyarchaeota archaeon]|nr:aldehyde ferredoxin oxidoreductase family protein [Candidatus Bathyarchaeota archaeon]